MHSSNTLRKLMLESRSRCLIFICIWFDSKFFRTKIACMSSAYIWFQAQSQSPQTSSSFIHIFAMLPMYLSHSSTCTHSPLHKQDLWKHGLLLPLTGHWSVLHLSPLPSYVLYWNSTGTESAWGNWGAWGNAHPKKWPALPSSTPAAFGGESAGKRKGGSDTQLASSGITWKWR